MYKVIQFERDYVYEEKNFNTIEECLNFVTDNYDADQFSFRIFEKEIPFKMTVVLA